jgi:hypothetical protein
LPVFPAGQFVHVDAPLELYLPQPQLEHEVAMEEDLYLPALQLEQTLLPVLDILPAPHAVHEVLPVEL